MAKTFSYKFKDGSEFISEELSRAKLDALTELHGACTFNGWAEFMGIGKPSSIGIIGGTNGSGFKSGWHPGLNMHIGGPAHYSKVLKEKGMVEVGNERQKERAPERKSYMSEEIIKQAVDGGAEITGNEAAALIKGESLTTAT